MGEEYDYEIITERLNSPLGENRFAAKVHFMVKRLGPGNTQQINPNLGERWGRTEEEAYRKAQQDVEDWIAKRTS